MPHPPPPVADAIAALDHFHVTGRRDAARLLSMWRRVGQLTPAQRAAVIDHFAPAAPGVLRCVVDQQARTGAVWIEFNHG